MKSFSILASLVACAFAQRLSIQEPTPMQNISSGTTITVELLDPEAATPVTQGSVVIAITQCFNVCDQPDQWSSSLVLYDGPFNAQSNNSAPQKGRHEDFSLALPKFQPGEAVLSVAHEFVSESAGANGTSLFEYTNIHINLQ